MHKRKSADAIDAPDPKQSKLTAIWQNAAVSPELLVPSTHILTPAVVGTPL